MWFPLPVVEKLYEPLAMWNFFFHPSMFLSTERCKLNSYTSITYSLHAKYLICTFILPDWPSSLYITLMRFSDFISNICSRHTNVFVSCPDPYSCLWSVVCCSCRCDLTQRYNAIWVKWQDSYCSTGNIFKSYRSPHSAFTTGFDESIIAGVWKRWDHRLFAWITELHNTIISHVHI